MAKLYFYYSTMNAGKSTTLLQSAYNYRERGMDVLIFTPDFDNRYQLNQITSRIGLKADAIGFNAQSKFYDYCSDALQKNPNIPCILLDEAQFLSKQQVNQLTEVVDNLKRPVLAYGLRTDFQGEPFKGSQYLLAWADELIELKTICHCGSKANRVCRVDADGNVLREGAQIVIGGNDKYVSTCRKHYKQGMLQSAKTKKLEPVEV